MRHHRRMLSCRRLTHANWYLSRDHLFVRFRTCLVTEELQTRCGVQPVYAQLLALPCLCCESSRWSACCQYGRVGPCAGSTAAAAAFEL